MNKCVRKSEAEMLELWEKRIFPWCGSYISSGSGVGTGRKAEGLFCNLDHYTYYYFGEPQEGNQEYSPTNEVKEGL